MFEKTKINKKAGVGPFFKNGSLRHATKATFLGATQDLIPVPTERAISRKECSNSELKVFLRQLTGELTSFNILSTDKTSSILLICLIDMTMLLEKRLGLTCFGELYSSGLHLAVRLGLTWFWRSD